MKITGFKFIAFCSYFVLLSAINSSAQLKKPGIIAGGNVLYAMPSGSFHETHSYGYGAEAFAGASLGKTYFVGTIGVSNYKAFNDRDGDIRYTPIKAGVRRYFLLKKIFVNADAGLGLVKNKATNKAESRILRGVGAGVRLFGLEGSLYYDGWKSLNSSGFSNSVNVKVGFSIVI
jgi:hypothetical protein